MSKLSSLAIARLLRPKSIAVVGASADPISVSGRLMTNLAAFGYDGQIHLVSRSRAELNGRACVKTIDELPEGIDAAVLIVPQVAVLDAVEACARRGIGGAVVFASGFAEAGDEGRRLQERIAEVARLSGVAMLGPNCMGFINAHDGACLSFGPFDPSVAAHGPRVAVVAQSGAMMGNATAALNARGLRVSYSVSTGNEAVVAVEDVLEHLIGRIEVDAFAVFVETLRDPGRFLELAARARDAGKPIVLLHPGRSDLARQAARSHTGALAGDHAVMQALVAREGVALVDTLDELFDVTTILARYPAPVVSPGAAIASNSGALRGICLDMCEGMGLELARLEQVTVDRLASVLPDYIVPDNPLDMTTAGMQNPAVFGSTAGSMLDDPGVGSLMIALMGGQAEAQLAKADSLLPVFAGTTRPVAFVLMGDDDPLDAEFTRRVRESSVPFFRSPDRALRAMAHVHRRSAAILQGAARSDVERTTVLLPSLKGPLAEYKGKALLRALGLPVPEGMLATNADAAAAAARDIGYPVVLKAQADALMHKSDVGGVAVGIRDEAQLRSAWNTMQNAVGQGAPDIVLDGLLVEAMSAPGVELVIGGRRDPLWGPVMLVGLGGIWIEALADVQLLPPDLTEDQIVAALRRLKGVKVLDGIRGRPAVDLLAVARATRRIADLMRSNPQVVEVDINPFVAFAQGQGGIALDALIVLADD